MKFISGLCCLLCLLAVKGAAIADSSARNLLGTERLEDDFRSSQRAVENSDAALPKPALPAELGKPLDAVTLDVKQFKVTGLPDGIQLPDALLEQFQGAKKSFEDLGNAATVIARHLQQNEGLYLAYAYVPAQDIQNGVVEIRVLPGILDKVEVIWPQEALFVNREVILAHLATLKPGQLIRVEEVERLVFLLNDLRGLKVEFQAVPGLQTGTASLMVKPTNRDKSQYGATLDNFGSRFAGRTRLGAQAVLNSPFGQGDALSANVLTSTSGGLRFGLLGYTLPVGSQGLKVGVNATLVEYKLDREALPIGAEGDSTGLGVFALYPFVRSRNFNTFVSVNLDSKSYSDRLTVAETETSRTVQQAGVTLSSDLRDSAFGGGISSLLFSYAGSDVGYDGGGASPLDADSTGTRLRWDASRLQTVTQGRVLAWFNLRGQQSSDSLDSSEQCSLGGPTGLRAYEQGVASGDECLLYTLELRLINPLRQILPTGWNHLISAFYEGGKSSLNAAQTTATPEDNDRTLSAWGIGINLEFQESLSAQFSVAKGRSSRAYEGIEENPTQAFGSVRYSF